MDYLDEGWQGDDIYVYKNDQFQEVMVRADSDHSAYEAVMDSLQTVDDPADIREAYNTFDVFSEYLTKRNKGTYEGGSPDWLRVCDFIRRWEGFFFDQMMDNVHGDYPELGESYGYNGNGGIIHRGYYEELRNADAGEKAEFYHVNDIPEEER